jgi:hypothetical protein
MPSAPLRFPFRLTQDRHETRWSLRKPIPPRSSASQQPRRAPGVDVAVRNAAGDQNGGGGSGNQQLMLQRYKPILLSAQKNQLDSGNPA